MILDEYLPILIRLGIATLLALIIYRGSYIRRYQSPGDKEKISPYECGFDPFEDARHKFQVKFYLVRILFLIFDLEVIYLFPWAVTLNRKDYYIFITSPDFSCGENNIIENRFIINEINYIIILIFLIILTIGFIYEWEKGALEW